MLNLIINKYLDRLIQALKEENSANRIMLDILQYLETDDKIYLKAANKQLEKFLKEQDLVFLLIFAFSPITVHVVQAEKLGIDIMPAWYKLDLKEDQNN